MCDIQNKIGLILGAKYSTMYKLIGMKMKFNDHNHKCKTNNSTY